MVVEGNGTIDPLPMASATLPPRTCWRKGVLLPFVVLLSACGGASTPVMLTIVGIGLDAGKQLQADALDPYSRSTGVRVDLIPAWGSSADQLAQMSRLLHQASNPPDLYLVDVVW